MEYLESYLIELPLINSETLLWNVKINTVSLPAQLSTKSNVD